MAQLIYNTAGNTGFDMRILDLDALLAGKALTAFNPFIIQWKNDATTPATVSILGQDLNPTVTGGVLTGLTGTSLSQLWVPNVDGTEFGLNMAGLAASVSGFFDLVQAKNWTGLAEFMRQGDDNIVGTKNNDTLLGGDGDDRFVAGLGRDLMTGGRGNDTMIATEGHDVMTGGQGADTFEFVETPYDNEWDIIKDFRSGVDQIQIQDVSFDHVGFGGFDGAPMAAIHFGLGRQARTADQGLIYDKARGFLYYDADGSGTQADRVLFAKLGAGTDLSYQDFWVV